MSVEEYSLNFTLLSKYDISLVSNPRNEMSRFFTGVSDIVKEKCRTTMLHSDINQSRLMMYAQSIEESKLERISRDAKRGKIESELNLILRRGLQIKMVLLLLRPTMREIVVLKVLSLLVLLVGRSTFRSI